MITVRPHPRYDRKGDDLYTDVEVALTTPVLGGEVEVQALDKKLALRLPAGTQNGQTFRLSGLGMPKLSQADKRGALSTSRSACRKRAGERASASCSKN